MITVNCYDKIKKRDFDKDFYDLRKCIAFMYKCKHSDKIMYYGYSCTENDEFQALIERGL